MLGAEAGDDAQPAAHAELSDTLAVLPVPGNAGTGEALVMSAEQTRGQSAAAASASTTAPAQLQSALDVISERASFGVRTWQRLLEFIELRAAAEEECASRRSRATYARTLHIPTHDSCLPVGRCTSARCEGPAPGVWGVPCFPPKRAFIGNASARAFQVLPRDCAMSGRVEHPAAARVLRPGRWQQRHGCVRLGGGARGLAA